MDNKLKSALSQTIKLQPLIILYSLVSIGSKLISMLLPKEKSISVQFVIECLTNVRLIGLLFAMVAILAIYAFFWQKCIKNADISVMYANKSIYIFWTQLAAVLIFHETITFMNLLGVIIIFTGIMVVNKK